MLCIEEDLRRFLHEIEDVAAIMDAILSVVHPELWKRALSAMALIKDLPGYEPEKTRAVAAWPTVFSALQVIVNRCTVYHRDTNARKEWMDLLLTLGNYGETAVMSLRNLGFCVPYDSGSIVAITTRLVTHGVPHVPGDRICVAFIMSDAVHSHFGTQCPSWAK